DSWVTLWHPIWMMVIILAAILYLYTLGSKQKFGTSTGQKAKFLVGLGLVYVFMGSPFSIVASHGLFSAYVFQLSVVYIVVPPLLISGLPTAQFHPMRWHHTVKKILTFVLHPLVTAILFNVGLSVYLFPSIFGPIHVHPLADGFC